MAEGDGVPFAGGGSVTETEFSWFDSRGENLTRSRYRKSRVLLYTAASHRISHALGECPMEGKGSPLIVGMATHC